MKRKRVKFVEIEEEEDRLSDLPDSIIQHILSFLPSTKLAIQTSVLSKRWHKQWTFLPDLFFDYFGMSSPNFHESIDNTLILHDCSKINKFHLRYSLFPKKDPHFASKIRFATRKNVDDLNLISFQEVYELPEFLFNYAPLINLSTKRCIFMPSGKVNWGCLTALNIEQCKLTGQALEHILSGTPLLRLLELNFCDGNQQLVIASQSLKRLVLESFESYSDIEISCPQLEELELPNVKTAKLLDLPSSLCAGIYFRNSGELNTCTRMIEDIMQQLQHVDELKIGNGSIEILSAMKVRDRFSLVLNIKCLTIHYPRLKKHHSGIACLLGISPVLEKLVIIAPSFCLYTAKYKIKNDYWISNPTVYHCLESHLKTIKIIDFPGRHGRRDLIMLNFVQFLLNKAKVLEKMVVVLNDNAKVEVSEILLSMPRCSQNAVIEVL